MPYEPAIRWIAVGLIGLGVLWIIAAAIGLRPRAIQLRRATSRGGSTGLVCGACGHPAVSLGGILACPECGARYVEVGLDAAGTARRWAPPLPVLGVLLLGLWGVGSIWLSPIAARWANQQSIGAAMVSRERIVAGFVPDPILGRQRVGALPSIAVEVDAELFRPLDPSTSLIRPPLSSSTIIVRAAMGPGMSNAGDQWRSAWLSSPNSLHSRLHIHGSTRPYGRPGFGAPATSPHPFASPWASMFAAVRPYEVIINAESTNWELRQPDGSIVARGRGTGEAIAVLFERAGLTSVTSSDRLNATSSGRALADAIEKVRSGQHASPISSFPYQGNATTMISEPAMRLIVSLHSMGDLVDDMTTHIYHRAAPLGLAAAIGTSALLLLIAMVLFAIAWPARRTQRAGGVAHT